MSQVYAIATMDTKATELAYVASCLSECECDVVTVDIGTKRPPALSPSFSRQQVLGQDLLPNGADRGESLAVMGDALTRFICQEHATGKVAGVIGIGGSGGTAVISQAMRALPIGLPKLMVSTVASGNVAPYVDCSDITLMYSVVDIAGLNIVSTKVLANAAHAMAGMIKAPASIAVPKPAVGMTMFGVTTPCVTSVREQLEQKGYDCLVFHATGSGGRAMEKLVESDMIRGVLDVTTTEVADEVVGGTMPAGPSRFDITIEKRIPLVMSLGAVDMVNFGAKETVPSKFRDRRLHVHNAHVTLMRTDAAENRLIARWIATKLNQSTAPLRLLMPLGGVSMLDAPQKPFHDPNANAALFAELKACVKQTETRQLIPSEHHINDPEFAKLLVQHFGEVTSG